MTELRVYSANSEQVIGRKVCIISDLDLSGVLTGVSLDLCEEEIRVVTAFSEMVHSIVFDCFAPNSPFKLYICVCGPDGLPDIPFITSAVSSNDSELMDNGEYPNTPFIVHSTTSKRLHRVDEILATEPSSFRLPTSNWKPLAECGKDPQTLSDYYLKTYGINVNEKQSIFVSPLGSLINPIDLVPSIDPLTLSNSCDAKPKNLLYLVPQLVRLSPLTEIIGQLASIPRILFWIERGLIARNVAQTIGLDINSTCSDNDVLDAIIPPEFVQYQSQCVSLVSIALTCPGADLPYNYERLEWLGDCVLRIVVIDELRASSNLINTNQVLSNDRMGKLCLEHCPKIAEKCILSTKPSLRNPAACRSKIRNLRILADIVEALICVSFVVSHVPGATEAARCLGILTNEDKKGSLASPASIRLEQSLIALKNAPAKAPVGHLDSLRNTLVNEVSNQ